jgi:L-2-hydroxyglutarate oxidase LhgO
MPHEIDCIIIGAGVIGLAIARTLAEANRDVLVLEAEGAPGTVTSSRNSGVIHAGLYYPPGSLRARLCVAGKRALYAYCDARGIPAPRCTKLVVATDPGEESTLALLAERATQNGAGAVRLISAREAHALEPALRCTAALLSPDTGIIDAHAYMLALQGDAAAAGALFAFHAPVDRVDRTADGFVVHAGGAHPTAVRCTTVINAAGLGAVALARRIEGLDAAHVPPSYLSKGSYFALAGASPFRRLIYPVPIPGGAGVHLTLDLAGQARFGPDVEAVECIDYAVEPHRADMFYAAIRRYWPGLHDGALVPGYAGIRPKIVPAAQAQDFVIQGPATHGIPGLVNLFGIESPGLTASLAIAAAVARSLADGEP